MQITVQPTSCRFCGTTRALLTFTSEGWQCSDGLDCYARQQEQEAKP